MIERFVSAVADPRSDKEPGPAVPLASLRTIQAYVLLGEPGMGKSFSFAQEVEAIGDSAKLMSIADFLHMTQSEAILAKDQVLFIDGLDESAELSPIQKIRTQLDALDWPKFRISCRSADWHGEDQLKKLHPPSGDAPIAYELVAFSDADIQRMLKEVHSIPDANAFLSRADEYGMRSMASSPHGLALLVRALEGDNGTKVAKLSKTDIYDRACRSLATEDNETHAAVHKPDARNILTTCEQLFALMLLAGQDGVSARDSNSIGIQRGRYLGPTAYNIDVAKLRTATRSSLFRTAVAGNLPKFAPAHRTIAEFLGARWLAARIDSGQSKRRLMRLLAHNERIGTNLRGLVGWLAVMSPGMFDLLVKVDPLAIMEYGDVELLTIAQRKQLFGELVRIAGERHSKVGRLFGAKASQIIVGSLDDREIAEHLSPREWTDKGEKVARLLLTSLSRKFSSELERTLYQLIVDHSVTFTARRDAMKLWLRSDPPGAQQLLKDIVSAPPNDKTDELRTLLLFHLYPGTLSAAEVATYLMANDLRFAGYSRWLGSLVAKVPEPDLGNFADAVASSNLVAFHHAPAIGKFKDELVVRLLNSIGTSAKTEQLAVWLSLGTEDYRHRDIEASKNIRQWLRANIDVCQNLLSHYFDQATAAHANWNAVLVKADEALCDVSARHDAEGEQVAADSIESFQQTMGTWLLGEAARLHNAHADDEMLIRIIMAANHLLLQDDTALHADTRAWLTGYPEIAASIEVAFSEVRSKQEMLTAKRAVSNQQWDDARERNFGNFLTIETALLTNSAPWHVLDALIRHWSGFCRTPDEEAATRLERFNKEFGKFDGRGQRVMDATARAFDSVLQRTNLPTSETLLALYADNRRDSAVHPLLIAMYRQWARDPASIDLLPTETLRLLLTAAFVDDLRVPPWLGRLADAHPDLVLATWRAFAPIAFKRARYNAPLFYGMAGKAATTIIKLLTLPTLEVLPAQLAPDHVGTLRQLLRGAWQQKLQHGLLRIAHAKIAMKSLDEAQLAYWLTISVLCEPSDAQAEQLFSFLSDPVRAQLRTQHVLDLLGYHSWSGFNLPDLQLPLAALGRLIEICVRFTNPPTEDDRGHDDRSETILALLHRIAATATTEARDELTRLAKLPSLATSKNTMAWLIQQQANVLHEATFRHAELADIVGILADESPKNIQDMFERVSDLIDELGVYLRTDNSNPLRAYWNTNGNTNDWTAKNENECRDRLLEFLRLRLPGISVEKEGYFIEDKRADIFITHNDARLPIELKRSMHDEIWESWNTQLAQYTKEPATEGYGLYVILWFGVGRLALPPGYSKPASATDAQKVLTNMIQKHGKTRTRGFVLDLSKPV